MDTLWYLSQVKLFKDLNSSEMKVIQSFTETFQLPKGTIIQSPLEQPSGIYFVKEGKLKIYNIHEDGKAFITGIIGKGHTFGNTSLFSLGTQNHYVESIEAVKICRIHQEKLENFLMERPEVLKALINDLNQKIKDQHEMLEKLALGDVKSKVLFWLVYLARHFGTSDGNFVKIDMTLSHQDLANMVGVSRESVSLTLQELAQEEKISSSRLRVSVSKELLSN